MWKTIVISEYRHSKKSIMTQFLPPNLLALFAPRDPLPYKPPADKLVHEKKSQPYSGLSAFVGSFEVCRVPIVLRYVDLCYASGWSHDIDTFLARNVHPAGGQFIPHS